MLLMIVIMITVTIVVVLFCDRKINGKLIKLVSLSVFEKIKKNPKN